MKIFLAFIIITMSSISHAVAEQLTYEGKVSAQIVRRVSEPFVIIVEQILAHVGEPVKKNQRLLEYRLEPGTKRGIQQELLTGGAQAEATINLSYQEGEALDLAAQQNLATELSSKGFGSNVEKNLSAKRHGITQKRIKGLERNLEAAKTDFSLRLAELETLFGIPLKLGQKLPDNFYMVSPLDGVIIGMSSLVRSKGRLESNIAAFNVAVLNPIQVQFMVYETEITKLHVGQTVTIDATNIPDVKLPGTVSMLNWEPIDSNIAAPSFYYVWVDVENPDYILKPGYKVIVHIDVK